MRSAASRFVHTLITVLSKRTVWLGLAFAAISGVAFEALGAMTGPMMQSTGLTSEAVGWFNLGPRVWGMVAGALLGGWISDRWGRRRTVGITTIALAIAVAGSGIAMMLEGLSGRATFILLLSATYILIGAFTASSYAMFMDLTEPDAAGTQFSAFMGATNLCEMWAAAAMGFMLGAQWGYTWALVILAGASLLALPILPLLPSGKRWQAKIESVSAGDSVYSEGTGSGRESTL